MYGVPMLYSKNLIHLHRIRCTYISNFGNFPAILFLHKLLCTSRNVYMLSTEMGSGTPEAENGSLDAIFHSLACCQFQMFGFFLKAL